MRSGLIKDTHRCVRPMLVFSEKMNNNKIENLKNYLFGTPDRIYTFASIVLSVLSFLVTVFTYEYPENIPHLIVVRDIAVVGLLLSTSGLLLWKYMRREQHLVAAVRNLEDSNQRLSKQFESFHILVHKFRSDLFLLYLGYVTEDLLVDQKTKNTFEKICHSVTSDLRAIYKQFLLSKGIDIGDDISISIKLTVSPNILIDILGGKMDNIKKRNIKKKKRWVITAYRDPHTFEKLRGIREVTQSIYSIEGNTAFDLTYSHKMEIYACDDLVKLGASYKNENKNWNKYYSSTLVAPIRFINTADERQFCFGFIAIDSINVNKSSLFEYSDARHIIGHAADLLATFFLTLAIANRCNINVGSPA